MKIFSIILVFLFVTINAQNIPWNFRLGKTTSDQFESPIPGSNSVEDIVIAGDTIVLATPRSISLSTDNGNTWNNFEELEIFDTEAVSRVAFRNGVIWAGLWHTEVLLGVSEPIGGGLMYSTDLGENWTFIPQPVDSAYERTIIYGVSTLGFNPTTTAARNFILDIELTADEIWITTRGGGIRKSSDMGQTWQRVILPPDYLDYIHPDSSYSFYLSGSSGNLSPEENLNHIPFSVISIDENTFIVGTAGGINKSTDGGNSWTKYNHINQSSPISGDHIWRLRFDPFDNSIWAVTWIAEGEGQYNAISRSTNMGETWTTYLPGVRAQDIAFRYFTDGASTVRRDIIAATEEGLYRSIDDGNSWILAPDISDANKRIEARDVEMHAVGINHHENNTASIFIGSSGGGLIKMLESGEAWDGDWEIYFVSGEDVSESNSSFVFPNPFSPFKSELTIKYSLNTASDVTIRIMDFGMNLVKTIIQNAPRNASESVFEKWDGRNENGEYVSNGVYFYRIDTGSDEPLYGKILVVK